LIPSQIFNCNPASQVWQFIGLEQQRQSAHKVSLVATAHFIFSLLNSEKLACPSTSMDKLGLATGNWLEILIIIDFDSLTNISRMRKLRDISLTGGPKDKNNS
jgi:hypothetical protein